MERMKFEPTTEQIQEWARHRVAQALAAEMDWHPYERFSDHWLTVADAALKSLGLDDYPSKNVLVDRDDLLRALAYMPTHEMAKARLEALFTCSATEGPSHD